jgi:hypothetical protein
MSPSDALWLKIWGLFAAIGFIMVIGGVVIEGVEHFKKFPKKEHGRKLQIEKIGWFIVVVGLAMEFLGDHAAKRISDREDARVNKEAADSRVTAGNAEREAGEANERAALTESNNLVLQSNVLALEIKLQPRTITEKQRKILIDSLKEIPKCRINIHCGIVNNETKIYAARIRDVLKDAGYDTSGIAYDLGLSVTTYSGSGVIMLAAVTNQDECSNFPAFFELQKAFEKIGISALGQPIPLPEAFPDVIRNSLSQNTNQFWNGPVQRIMATEPDQIVIIINEVDY